jgi:DNA-binding transcriptional regulator YiaG
MTIKEARMKAGISRAEMSRRFEIPIRTLENWESGVNQPPAWAEKLIVEKLYSMCEATGQ